MGIDIAWARAELDHFLELTELRSLSNSPGDLAYTSTRKITSRTEKDVVASAQVVEQILDRVLPGWQDEVPGNSAGPGSTAGTSTAKPPTARTSFWSATRRYASASVTTPHS
ncbi:hypothetical protein AB0B78_32490 [Streptomyces sp. NPDC040724]|uniref:hypothetical protein n=1 Tax=Streptomyces sp. NPDC040724 TaxID=3155612 RepID=UPI0033CDD81E